MENTARKEPGREIELHAQTDMPPPLKQKVARLKRFVKQKCYGEVTSVVKETLLSGLDIKGNVDFVYYGGRWRS